VRFTTYPYGGNGATSSECPDGRNWMIDTLVKARTDPRISGVTVADYSDTPLTMTRNRAVVDARKDGVDVLVMLDSDQAPDMYLGSDPEAVPFWDAAFNFIYNHYDRGPVCVASPYCGPPPHENIYVFRWRAASSDNPDDQFALEQYTREEAVEMSGIHECAALPTGLIMFDMRCFDLTEPCDEQWSERFRQYLSEPLFRRRVLPDGDIREERLPPPALDDDYINRLVAWSAREKINTEQSWFYYEYSDKYQCEKHSTEDVTATRDMSVAGQMRLGYNPVHCAWSSWAGHWKPKCVGKPQLIGTDFVASKLKRAALANRTAERKQVDVSRLRDNGRIQNVIRNSPDGKAVPCD
jgi:hypothetical protein